MNDVVKGSAMRFSLTLTTIGVFIIFLTIGFYIVMKAIKGLEPEWSTMSIFAIGLAGVLTGAGWNKTQQKKLENGESE